MKKKYMSPRIVRKRERDARMERRVSHDFVSRSQRHRGERREKKEVVVGITPRQHAPSVKNKKNTLSRPSRFVIALMQFNELMSGVRNKKKEGDRIVATFIYRPGYKKAIHHKKERR